MKYGTGHFYAIYLVMEMKKKKRIRNKIFAFFSFFRGSLHIGAFLILYGKFVEYDETKEKRRGRICFR